MKIITSRTIKKWKQGRRGGGVGSGRTRLSDSIYWLYKRIRTYIYFFFHYSRIFHTEHSVSLPYLYHFPLFFPFFYILSLSLFRFLVSYFFPVFFLSFFFFYSGPLNATTYDVSRKTLVVHFPVTPASLPPSLPPNLPLSDESIINLVILPHRSFTFVVTKFPLSFSLDRV